jgi:hypothetical protein
LRKLVRNTFLQIKLLGEYLPPQNESNSIWLATKLSNNGLFSLRLLVMR